MSQGDAVKRPKRKPPGRFHHGDLREALVGAAVDVVEREGAAAVSLRALAKRVGVTEPAIYRHFEGRDALLVEVGKRGLDGFDDALVRSVTGIDDPFDAARCMAGAYVRYAQAHPGWFRLWFGRSRYEELAGKHEDARVIGVGPRANEVLSAKMMRAFPPGLPEIEHIARGYWALMHGLAIFVVERVFQLVQTDDERILAADGVIATHVDNLRVLYGPDGALRQRAGADRR